MSSGTELTEIDKWNPTLWGLYKFTNAACSLPLSDKRKRTASLKQVIGLGVVALGRLKEDYEFEASLGCTERPCLKKQAKKK
jgi:hypothetical protein